MIVRKKGEKPGKSAKGENRQKNKGKACCCGASAAEKGERLEKRQSDENLKGKGVSRHLTGMSKRFGVGTRGNTTLIGARQKGFPSCTRGEAGAGTDWRVETRRQIIEVVPKTHSVKKSHVSIDRATSAGCNGPAISQQSEIEMN